MVGKSMMCTLVVWMFACLSEPRVEDEMELSCPDGEPTEMNIKHSAKQRLKLTAKKERCTLDFENTYKIERKGKPNVAGKCAVVVSAVCN